MRVSVRRCVRACVCVSARARACVRMLNCKGWCKGYEGNNETENKAQRRPPAGRASYRLGLGVGGEGVGFWAVWRGGRDPCPPSALPIGRGPLQGPGTQVVTSRPLHLGRYTDPGRRCCLPEHPLLRDPRPAPRAPVRRPQRHHHRAVPAHPPPPPPPPPSHVTVRRYSMAARGFTPGGIATRE